MCIRVPYSVSCMIVLVACIVENIVAIFFARNGLNRNTTNMLICFLYEKARLKCSHSKEFFFLYDHSKSTTPKKSDEDDTEPTEESDLESSTTPQPISTTATSKIATDGMEILYKGNNFFMMPMYMSVTNLYTFIVVVHLVMIAIHVLDFIVIKYLRNDQRIKKAFLGAWMFAYSLFTLFEATIIIICWSQPERCRRCVSNGVHPDMMAVWNANCAIDLIFQCVKGITYILLHLLYIRKLKDLGMREMLFAYELEYLAQAKLAEKQRRASEQAALKRETADTIRP